MPQIYTTQEKTFIFKLPSSINDGKTKLLQNKVASNPDWQKIAFEVKSKKAKVTQRETASYLTSNKNWSVQR